MSTIMTNIVDTKATHIVHGANKFSATGLGLAVNWEHNIREIVVISDQKPENLEKTLTSIYSLGYTVTAFPEFTATGTKLDEYSDPKVDISFLMNIRNMHHNLKATEVTRILSHALVWNYCVQQQHPVIVVEAGNIPNKLLEVHIPRNSIINLTDKPLLEINKNWYSFQGWEAYSVDQFVAKQLLAHLYTQGIRDSLTVMAREDLFCICEN
jgi:hypothetical protein